jgi:hypothetical protein
MLLTPLLKGTIKRGTMSILANFTIFYACEYVWPNWTNLWNTADTLSLYITNLDLTKFVFIRKLRPKRFHQIDPSTDSGSTTTRRATRGWGESENFFTLAGLEPWIFCSGGGRDGHYATPPGPHTLFILCTGLLDTNLSLGKYVKLISLKAKW